MLNETSGTTKILISILFFPYFFQADMIAFAWGATDPEWLMIAKRALILLPVGAVLVGLWGSILSLMTIIIRQNRREFGTAILVTWWDLGNAILQFWFGMSKALFVLAGGIFGLAKVMVVGTWYVIQDILFVPFRMAKSIADSPLSPILLAWILAAVVRVTQAAASKGDPG